MIISYTHKYIFIKSQKTAGTSIEAALSNYCRAEDIVTPLCDYDFNRNEKGKWVHRSMNAGDFQQHDGWVTIKEKVAPNIWDEYFKFSIVRNPWERVVSLFNWRSRNEAALKPQKRFYHRLGVPFNEVEETRKVFSEFVKGDWQTNDQFYVIEGECCTDYIIRYENLNEDFKKVCERIGLAEMELPRLKSGFKRGYHYSEYYDDDSKAIVAERHRNDIRLFGYQFESV